MPLPSRQRHDGAGGQRGNQRGIEVDKPVFLERTHCELSRSGIEIKVATLAARVANNVAACGQV
ncbi:hypothetical protein GCM10007388_05400 [Pseudoduganella plicata]|uniref:Uncharacterized protein n=1 Tax=Pseudoduganella plicata TaxID=321984 RepID=A0AA87XZU2_9BURK|nr:hypothetical protein GCM10007388_05400 [Pseudoduganella plicata]